MRYILHTQNRRLGLFSSIALGLVGLAVLFVLGMMFFVVVIPLSLIGWYVLRKKMKRNTSHLKTYNMPDGWPPQQEGPRPPAIEKQF